MEIKNILWIFIVLLSIISISASIGTFKQNDCITIKTTSNATSVNISTISYPNSTIAITNKDMIKNGMLFSYIYCNTSLIGTYVYDYFDSNGNVYVNDFTITPSGTTFDLPQAMIYMVGLTLLILMFLSISYLAWTIPFKNPVKNDGILTAVNQYRTFKVGLFAIAYLFSMLIIALMIMLSSNFLMLDGLYKILTSIYTIQLALVYPIIIITAVFCFILFISDFLSNKRIEKLTRGLYQDG